MTDRAAILAEITLLMQGPRRENWPGAVTAREVAISQGVDADKVRKRLKRLVAAGELAAVDGILIDGRRQTLYWKIES